MDLILDSDVIFKIMLVSEFQDALNISLVNKTCYNIFHTNQIFWEEMLNRIINQDDKGCIWINDNKSTFIRCFKIKKFIKNVYELPATIINAFILRDLNLNNNQLTSIPSEIGQLVNLQNSIL